MSNNAIADISIDLIYPTQQKLKMLNKLRDTFRIQHQHNPNCLKMQVLCSPEPVPMLNAIHFACKLNEYQFTITRMSNTCRLCRRRKSSRRPRIMCGLLGRKSRNGLRDFYVCQRHIPKRIYCQIHLGKLLYVQK